MKIAAQDSAKQRRPSRPEIVILFSVASQTFAIAADAVQEIRSTDSLAGAVIELDNSNLAKARHFFERERRHWYVVNAGMHFGLPVTRPTLVLVLRDVRAAVLVDSIERMAEISAIHPLPLGFQGEERQWYRGLTYFEDHVIPVIRPEGFLTPRETEALDRDSKSNQLLRDMEGAVEA